MIEPSWPELPYEPWSETRDTLHALTQVLGKSAAALAPPEPQLQHAALRLTARGWETRLLRAPNGSGGLVMALDLRRHELVVEHTNGGGGHIPLLPARSVGETTRAVLDMVRGAAGDFVVDMAPQETPWQVPLDTDDEHGAYDRERVRLYFRAATQAALVLAAFRASYRGRSTPVNAWWGSFDLAVNLFSGRPAEPPSQDFIMRNAMDAQEVAVGWWPGDARFAHAAFYAYAHPAPDDFASGTVAPRPARWEPTLGEFVLKWDDVRSARDPFGASLEFARSVFRHACAVCEWDPQLAASAHGEPPPMA